MADILNDETLRTTANGMSQSMNQLTSSLGASVRTRSGEQVDLQNLNNRLASYIGSVRILELENSRLNDVLKSSTKSNDREKIATKKIYDDVLAETRKNLDEVRSEKAKLDIEHTKALVDNDNLKSELGKLRKVLEETQENLKNEIVSRVNSQNIVARLREELVLQGQIHKEELYETRLQVDTSKISSGLNEQYNAQLQESLQELRDQCGGQIRWTRDEIKLLLDGAMRNERNCFERENKSLSSALKCSHNRNELNHVRIGELGKLNAALNTQIRNLESSLEEERAQGAKGVTELKTLRQELDLQSIKYQDLMDEKLSMSLELAAYNQLLSNGEHCLKIEPPAKRYRTDIELIEDRTVTSSYAGNIEISEVDSEGKFIKLRNKSDNEAVSIGGWKLIRQADGCENVHEFDRLVQVDAIGELIVWSANSGFSVSPFHVLNDQKWAVGDELKITLVNDSGNIEAKRIQKKLSPAHPVEIQQPNAEPENSKRKCVVM